jgi:hypothetical protein
VDPARVPSPATPRRVTIDLPAGYALSITLTPFDPELADPEAAMEAITSVEQEVVE